MLQKIIDWLWINFGKPDRWTKSMTGNIAQLLELTENNIVKNELTNGLQKGWWDLVAAQKSERKNWNLMQTYRRPKHDPERAYVKSAERIEMKEGKWWHAALGRVSDQRELMQFEIVYLESLIDEGHEHEFFEGWLEKLDEREEKSLARYDERKSMERYAKEQRREWEAKRNRLVKRAEDRSATGKRHHGYLENNKDWIRVANEVSRRMKSLISTTWLH